MRQYLESDDGVGRRRRRSTRSSMGRGILGAGRGGSPRPQGYARYMVVRLVGLPNTIKCRSGAEGEAPLHANTIPGHAFTGVSAVQDLQY